MHPLWPRFAIIAALVIGSGEFALGAAITAVDSKDGKTRLDLVGEITPGDADAVKFAIQKANNANRVVVTIRLNSSGGNLYESAVIADIVRKGKISTSVLSNFTCASGCFVIFAAGHEKFAHYTAQIGVHGASGEDGRETTQSNAATVGMARILREFGVPASIIGKMVVTPPEQMVWLTIDDLRSMETKMFGKPMQLPTDQPTTSQLQPPIKLSPGAQANAPAKQMPTWSELVDGAIRLSARQNNGKADYGRICQPELKTCSTAIIFKTNDGTDSIIKVTEDLNGKIIEREICTFNKPGDVRSCWNWDTKRGHRDMKNERGDWYKVADE
jgi:ATP-dependent protease ClpP protease subunit